MRRYSGHKEPWGEFVDAKINAPEILKKQLERAKKGTVWVSSVCDPYQPLEAEYGLTRRCLEELTKSRFPVNIQTKSKLVPGSWTSGKLNKLRSDSRLLQT
jgi:DNA repair photolyase